MDRTEFKDKYRKAISDVLLQEPFFDEEQDSVVISEALVEAAFTSRDWNGGEADTDHAAEALHEIVDAVAAARKDALKRQGKL